MNARAGLALVLLVLIASVALAGCRRGTTPDGTATGDSTTSPGATPAAAIIDTTFQRGSVRVRGDSLFFAACGSTAEARLDDRTGGTLASAVRSLADGGQAVYVEMNGGPAGAGTVAAVEFLRAAPIGEGGGCGRAPEAYLYQAFGEEPFWSVHVWTDSVVFQQPDEPNRVAWPATAVVPARDAAGARTWTAAAQGGHPALTLTIERAPCTDGMSGEVTAFRARATFGGRALQGCARAGTAADEVR
jgi:uncharacterized membrane protein